MIRRVRAIAHQSVNERVMRYKEYGSWNENGGRCPGGVKRRRATQGGNPPRTGSCLSTAAVSGTRAARGFRWSDHHFRSMSLGHINQDLELAHASSKKPSPL